MGVLYGKYNTVASKNVGVKNLEGDYITNYKIKASVKNMLVNILVVFWLHYSIEHTYYIMEPS